MRVAMLGASGRTGRLVAAALARRGHVVTALVRDPAASPPEAADVVVGSVLDPDAVDRAVGGVDAVLSTLGPTGGEPDLHARAVAVVVPALASAGVPPVRLGRRRRHGRTRRRQAAP